ncbi:MAG TPA: Asp-tRNA(Asn)/Glu-tRNA(Gln) amidotransferase subunit GatB, partial [Flavisolibacter sp.]
YPGTLPRLNEQAVMLAVKLGIATGCTITPVNYFARKNYFYPDLPKGYQISQHTTPIATGGKLRISSNSAETFIRINRIHMEEDAGKSIHDADLPYSRIDYNRAGIPLVEIVTEPDIRTAGEAGAFVSTLRSLVRRLQVCDGNMEQGSLRCDVNISVREKGEKALGVKVEIKNLNSIRFIRRAIEFETERLVSLHRSGGKIVQETRGFDEDSMSTYSIRVKEDEDDYRYFPDPDLPPFKITPQMISSILAALPESPEIIRGRLVSRYGLTENDAAQLVADDELLAWFHRLAACTSDHRSAANWTLGPVRNYLAANDLSAEDFPVPPASIAVLIDMIGARSISYGIAIHEIFPALLRDPALDVRGLLSNEQLLVRDDATLDAWVTQSLTKHSQKIPAYKKGKKGLLSLFVGEVMKLSGGKADAKIVTDKIIEKLNTYE